LAFSIPVEWSALREASPSWIVTLGGLASFICKESNMPKMTDRERLAKIEADQQALASEAETVRGSLRAHYGKILADLPAERLSERDFRDVLLQAIRVGGAVALTALKALPALSDPTAARTESSDPDASVKRRQANGGQGILQP
jgi:hypothetical protein